MHKCVCVCGTLLPRVLPCQRRGLAAYSVMPANEASGRGGWSYGRIALYLQRGGQDPYPPTKLGAFPFTKTRFSGSDERSSACQTCPLH